MNFEAEWYTRVREVMHLNGGPVCYLRMNIGKVDLSCLLFAKAFMDNATLAFSWRTMGASCWEWQEGWRLPLSLSLSRWKETYTN